MLTVMHTLPEHTEEKRTLEVAISETPYREGGRDEGNVSTLGTGTRMLKWLAV